MSTNNNSFFGIIVAIIAIIAIIAIGIVTFIAIQAIDQGESDAIIPTSVNFNLSSDQ